MSENRFLPGYIKMIDINGNEIEVEGNLTYCKEVESTDFLNPYETSVTSNTFSFEITKSNNLTRKKFVKLLMSKGIGSNGANEIAKYVHKKNGRYTAFDLLMW